MEGELGLRVGQKALAHLVRVGHTDWVQRLEQYRVVTR